MEAMNEHADGDVSVVSQVHNLRTFLSTLFETDKPATEVEQFIMNFIDEHEDDEYIAISPYLLSLLNKEEAHE